jgi:hypothetical protein
MSQKLQKKAKEWKKGRFGIGKETQVRIDLAVCRMYGEYNNPLVVLLSSRSGIGSACYKGKEEGGIPDDNTT